MRLTSLTCVLALAVSAQAQKMLEWSNNTIGVTYKLAIPEASLGPFDMAWSIVAPVGMGWAALSMGGCMLRSPLLVAWPNGKSVVVSPRWAK